MRKKKWKYTWPELGVPIPPESKAEMREIMDNARTTFPEPIGIYEGEALHIVASRRGVRLEIVRNNRVWLYEIKEAVRDWIEALAVSCVNGCSNTIAAVNWLLRGGKP